MKKFLTVLFTLAVATSLAMPVYARKHKKAKDADAMGQTEKAPKKHKKNKKDKAAEMAPRQ